MKTYHKGIILVLLMTALINLRASFDEKSFWDSLTFISQENFNVYVNDEAIILSQLEGIKVIDKDSGKRMDLGLSITIPNNQLNEEDHCKINKTHIVNKYDVVEYYICDDVAYLTKHNMKDFSVTNKSVNVKKYKGEANVNLYQIQSMSNFGDGDWILINKDIYSSKSNYLYKNNIKIIEEPLLFSYFVIDDEEVFYINNNYDLKMVQSNNVIPIVEKDAQSVLVTSRYIYYHSLKTNQMVQINKSDHTLLQTFSQESSHKIRDYDDIVLMENNGRLSIYQDTIQIKEFKDVEDFDIDDFYIYALNNEAIIRKINRNTFEVEAVFE